MKKIFLIILAMAIIAGGGWYLLKGEKTPQSITQKAEEEKYSGTLQKMMGLGMPLKCTWKQSVDVSATSWILGEKSYSEINSQGQKSSVLIKDTCMWSWREGDSNGVKMCYGSLEELQSKESSTSEQKTGEIDLRQIKPSENMEYDCRPAAFTGDKFTLPSNVEFIDLEKAIPQSIEDLKNMDAEEIKNMQEKVKEFLPKGT